MVKSRAIHDKVYLTYMYKVYTSLFALNITSLHAAARTRTCNLLLAFSLMPPFVRLTLTFSAISLRRRGAGMRTSSVVTRLCDVM